MKERKKEGEKGRKEGKNFGGNEYWVDHGSGGSLILNPSLISALEEN